MTAKSGGPRADPEGRQAAKVVSGLSVEAIGESIRVRRSAPRSRLLGEGRIGIGFVARRFWGWYPRAGALSQSQSLPPSGGPCEQVPESRSSGAIGQARVGKIFRKHMAYSIRRGSVEEAL